MNRISKSHRDGVWFVLMCWCNIYAMCNALVPFPSKQSILINGHFLENRQEMLNIAEEQKYFFVIVIIYKEQKYFREHPCFRHQSHLPHQFQNRVVQFFSEESLVKILLCRCWGQGGEHPGTERHPQTGKKHLKMSFTTQVIENWGFFITSNGQNILFCMTEVSAFPIWVEKLTFVKFML